MSQQPTVLIVEDDPVFRRVMNFSIARCGFSVETASDGQAAYRRLCQGGIDFLVTDHQMPVCSGLELLEMLESNPDLIRPPTILCTAKGLELDSQGLQTRFALAAVMHKPFSPRKLSELIQEIIQTDSAPAKVSATPVALDHPSGAGAAARGQVDE
jgi:CheY-like chemotaxis protein